VDARTKAGLETGATFWRSQNQVVDAKRCRCRREKSLCWRFGAAFFRLITAQIGTFLQEISSLALKECIYAPTLVKSTYLLDFCTCFHR
jgi:hypothetical protein